MNQYIAMAKKLSGQDLKETYGPRYRPHTVMTNMLDGQVCCHCGQSIAKLEKVTFQKDVGMSHVECPATELVTPENARPSDARSGSR